MKIMSMAALAAATSLTLTNTADAASAYRVSPATPFTASGPISLVTQNGELDCSLDVTGTDNPARITSATFDGPQGCSSIVASNLPWLVRPTNTSGGFLLHVTLLSPDFVQCGRNEVHFTLQGGVLSVNDLLPSRKTGEVCRINTSLTTTPNLFISAR